MQSNFQNIFTYKTYTSYKENSCINNESDSDSYDNCIMMVDIGNAKKGTHIPSISIGMILYIFDMNGMYLKEDYLYDKFINKEEKDVTDGKEKSFYDIFTYEQKFDNTNNQFHPYSYHNCKMLKDIGQLKKDSSYSQIAIGAQFAGFNDNNELIYDELIS